MNRFIILFKLGLVVIPFYALGYFLHFSFRHLPSWVHIICNIILFIVFIYYVYKGRKKFIDEGSEDYIPEHLENSSYIYIIMASIIGYFVSASLFRTVLYVDNGRATPVEISILHEEILKIPAKSHIATSVATGTNEIIMEGKTKSISLPERGNWIYNIDSLNTYLETTVNYSSDIEIFKDGKIDSNKLNNPNYKIIRSELFKANVDYLFEVPESITVKKRDVGSTITKKVLYKITEKI